MKRYHSLYLFIIALLLAGYSWLFYHYLHAGQDTDMQLCLFHHLTGFACPSCGTTRSLVACLRGDWKAALLINPFGIIMLCGMVLLPLFILHDMVFKKINVIRLYQGVEQYVKRPAIALLLIVLVLANWCWNIYKDL